MAKWTANTTKGNQNEQNNEIKRYWFVMLSAEGFECTMMVYGTQTGLWNYMRNSFSYNVYYRYRSATEEEFRTALNLGIKAYIC